MTLPQGQGLGCAAAESLVHSNPVRSSRASLPTVKTVRIWFLLLLAVLLPIRGAVAATMLCAVGGAAVRTELRPSHHPVDHETMDHTIAHDHAAAHDHAGASHHDDSEHGQAASDKCSTCSAYCSLTPLLGAVPTLVEPLGLAAVKLSDHSAPPPSFLSGGQERPPRAI